MDERDWLAERFQAPPPLAAGGGLPAARLGRRGRRRRPGCLGAVSRAGADGVEELKAWLTTIVARVCLNLLRSGTARRERPIPDPIVSPEVGPDPEAEAVLADSVGFALQIVIGTLAPAERLAFVLHDIFDLPFDEIAAIVGRTPQATRQLASRARRRVKEAELPAPERDLARQRKVVDAFFRHRPRWRLRRLHVAADRIVEIDTIADPERVAELACGRGSHRSGTTRRF
jgi:DNA-directed RNA polymerase specialized sigma24 family protein